MTDRPPKGNSGYPVSAENDAAPPDSPRPGEKAPATIPPPSPRRNESSAPPSPGPSPSTHRSVPPPADPERKGLFERAVPELVKRVLERAVESGVEKLTELSEKPDNLRNFVNDLRLPKEVLADVYGQIDDTKNGLYRVVAKEIRDVLEQTHIADEIVHALTKLSFEIKTEIRFVPNDRAAGDEVDDGSPRKPKITTEVSVKERPPEPRKR